MLAVVVCLLSFLSPFHRGLYSDGTRIGRHLTSCSLRFCPLFIGASIPTYGLSIPQVEPSWFLSPFHRGLYSDINNSRELGPPGPRCFCPLFIGASIPTFKTPLTPKYGSMFLSPFHRGLYSDSTLNYWIRKGNNYVSVPFSSGPLFRRDKFGDRDRSWRVFPRNWPRPSL